MTENATARPGARLEVEERRAQLLDIGTELFSRRSFDDISIDEIADAAGISKGLLYHYFSGKRGFYIAVIRHSAETLLAASAGQRIAVSEDPLRAGLDAYLAYVGDHARIYVMLLSGGIGSDGEVRAIVDGTRERFVKRILGIAGSDSSSAALRLAVRGWVGFVEGASLDWVVTRDLPADQLRELLVRVLADALRAAKAQDAELELPELR